MRRTYPQLLKLFILLLLTLASGIDTAQAQTTTATLSGTITDAQGAIVAGASITVTNPATGQQRQTVTNDEGFFTVVQLPPILTVKPQNGFCRHFGDAKSALAKIFFPNFQPTL